VLTERYYILLRPAVALSDNRCTSVGANANSAREGRLCLRRKQIVIIPATIIDEDPDQKSLQTAAEDAGAAYMKCERSLYRAYAGRQTLRRTNFECAQSFLKRGRAGPEELHQCRQCSMLVRVARIECGMHLTGVAKCTSFGTLFQKLLYCVVTIGVNRLLEVVDVRDCRERQVRCYGVSADEYVEVAIRESLEAVNGSNASTLRHVAGSSCPRPENISICRADAWRKLTQPSPCPAQRSETRDTREVSRC